MDPVADAHEPRHDFAGDAKAEVAFVARPHHTDELARRGFVLERDALYLHGAFAFRRRGGAGLASREQQHHSEGGKAVTRSHRSLPDHKRVMTDEVLKSSGFRRRKSHVRGPMAITCGV